MDDVAVRARCALCGRGLTFEEWQAGRQRCSSCRAAGRAPASSGAEAPPIDYTQLLDEVSDDLLNELLALLDEEQVRRRSSREPVLPPEPTPLARFLSDVFGPPSPREQSWAAWGFALGFAANVLLAKLAQAESGAPLADIVVPMLLGGATAGGIGALIGWALARLRDR
ncbi:hypothetical protein HRbin29_00033 [bacterium HR29]|jgi:hypothetical protein|nr:hypothetical protein HRbin29_00033 [bacterium HR29]